MASSSAVEHLFEPTDTDEFPGPFSEDKVVSTYFDALKDVDPDLAFDLSQRIEQLASLAGHVCTVQYVPKGSTIVYKTHENCRVLSSGLQLSAALASLPGRSAMHPMLELSPLGEDEGVAYVAMDWDPVRAIKVIK